MKPIGLLYVFIVPIITIFLCRVTVAGEIWKGKQQPVLRAADYFLDLVDIVGALLQQMAKARKDTEKYQLMSCQANL